MKYRLGLRKITEGDMNRDCLLLPEPEDYEMYVTAMTEDINQLEIVEYALMDNSSIVIKLVVGFNIEHLNKQLPQYNRNIGMCYERQGLKISPNKEFEVLLKYEHTKKSPHLKFYR